MNSNSIKQWLSANIFQLIILVGGALLTWGALNARVSAIEKKVAQYPSSDYFELKFEEVSKDIGVNTEAINDLAKEVYQRNNEIK